MLVHGSFGYQAIINSSTITFFMKYFIAILSLLLATCLKAQKISPAVVNSGGSSMVLNNVHYDFSLGEICTLSMGNR